MSTFSVFVTSIDYNFGLVIGVALVVLKQIQNSVLHNTLVAKYEKMLTAKAFLCMLLKRRFVTNAHTITRINCISYRKNKTILKTVLLLETVFNRQATFNSPTYHSYTYSTHLHLCTMEIIYHLRCGLDKNTEPTLYVLYACPNHTSHAVISIFHSKGCFNPL